MAAFWNIIKGENMDMAVQDKAVFRFPVIRKTMYPAQSIAIETNTPLQITARFPKTASESLNALSAARNRGNPGVISMREVDGSGPWSR